MADPRVGAPIDANGNLTSDGTRTFEWDAVNRFVAVNDGTKRSEFSYDGLSRRTRIVEKENGATVRDAALFWDGTGIVEERLSTGEVNRFFADGEQHNGAARYLTRDLLGSVREVTDSAGTLVTRNDFDPYGRLTRVGATEDSRFAYTGHLNHVPSGLVLALYRAYDPTLGRWLSEDPEGFIDGPMMFAYVLNGPVNARDPFGLQTWPTNYPKVTAPFGENRGSGSHSGADIRNPLNEPVFSTDSGVVDNVWHNPRGGNQIRIKNDDDSVSGYAHTKGEVSKGQRVTEGQRIGHSDGSGTGNAPHLHLTYRPKPGAPVADPIPRLKPRGPKPPPAAGGCRLQ